MLIIRATFLAATAIGLIISGLAQADERGLVIPSELSTSQMAQDQMFNTSATAYQPVPVVPDRTTPEEDDHAIAYSAPVGLVSVNTSADEPGGVYDVPKGGGFNGSQAMLRASDPNLPSSGPDEPYFLGATLFFTVYLVLAGLVGLLGFAVRCFAKDRGR
jgi:hypothetical protein